MKEQTKQCKKCGQIKTLSEFSEHSGTKDKHRHECKGCFRIYWNKYAKKWRKQHREKYLERQRNWQEENREKVRGYSRKFYWANREKEILRVSKGNVARHARLRFKCLMEYGGNPPRCACCVEYCIEFLTIDHINNDGAKHRKEWKRYGSIYEWLRAKKYPKGRFQILCMNCNWCKGKYGYCPHQTNEPTKKHPTQKKPDPASITRFLSVEKRGRPMATQK